MVGVPAEGGAEFVTGRDGDDGEDLLAIHGGLLELEEQGYVVRLGPDTWQLTPAGIALVENMMGGGDVPLPTS